MVRTLRNGLAATQRTEDKLRGISGMIVGWSGICCLGRGPSLRQVLVYHIHEAEGSECTRITWCLGFGRVETSVLMVPRSQHLTADSIGY
jgi:hypothetical protein